MQNTHEVSTAKSLEIVPQVTAQARREEAIADCKAGRFNSANKIFDELMNDLRDHNEEKDDEDGLVVSRIYEHLSPHTRVYEQARTLRDRGFSLKGRQALRVNGGMTDELLAEAWDDLYEAEKLFEQLIGHNNLKWTSENLHLLNNEYEETRLMRMRLNGIRWALGRISLDIYKLLAGEISTTPEEEGLSREPSKEKPAYVRKDNMYRNVARAITNGGYRRKGYLGDLWRNTLGAEARGLMSKEDDKELGRRAIDFVVYSQAALGKTAARRAIKRRP